MTRENLFKIISENNQAILENAIELGYYDENDIEELRRKIEKIKIIFDCSNPEIYGVYSRNSMSITLNNEQFKDELTALIYYTHELLHAIDDRGDSVGYQRDDVSYIMPGVGINEGATQRKAENIVKKMLGVEPKIRKETSIGIELSTDLNEYEIEDKLNQLLARALGITYNDFLRINNCKGVADIVRDICGYTEPFYHAGDGIQNLIDEVYRYRHSTWFSKEEYEERVNDHYLKVGYKRNTDYDMEDCWVYELITQYDFYYSGQKDTFILEKVNVNLKNTIIEAEKQILNIFLRREFLLREISSLDEFVALVDSFVVNFIIPVSIDYEQLYDKIVQQNEYDLYNLFKKENRTNPRFFYIYQYQHDVILSRIKDFDALKEFRIININIDDHDFDSFIINDNYDKDSLLDMFNNTNNQLLKEGNSLSMYVTDGIDYYLIFINLTRKENGKLDCIVTKKNKVNVEEIIDNTLYNLCNGNQDEFITLFDKVNMPCEKKRAIIRKQRYENELAGVKDFFDFFVDKFNNKKSSQTFFDDSELGAMFNFDESDDDTKKLGTKK